MAAPTYFTCTLGQAAALENQQKHRTVNAFVEAQASLLHDQPAVGFAEPPKSKDGEWNYTIYTFAQIYHGSTEFAHRLLAEHGDKLTSRRTVALLCPSTPEFLFTWIALMILGHAVLLIAPQCQPAAIRSLCDQCEVELLFYDEVYDKQAIEAAGLASTGEEPHGKLSVAQLQFGPGCAITDLLNATSKRIPSPDPPVREDDVAYLHHTSGTSSGVPKPIPQPHRAAVGVLPSFPAGVESATFTTTPLYHGGIADLFRAWTSGALIWLFPGKAVPITAGNIIKCLDIGADASESQRAIAPVKYFSSVPYVLQMLESDERGMKYLTSMSMVGVGGAALPAEIGDRLVNRGVNLLSRFGSAECGFLLSSQREFVEDKDWQYLRAPPESQYIRFEQQADGLSELVVAADWPHMAKRNRDDGSYATSDLFAPHPSIEGAWKYHSRADSQLTLIIGKKFDPAPLEDAIGTSELVDDVLIFGNGQAYPGVLLFRSHSAAHLGDDQFVQQLWPSIEKLNAESQDHARLAKAMVIPMPVLDSPLQKSSKGTLLRAAAEKRFAKEIEAAYGEEGIVAGKDVEDDAVMQEVKSIVLDVTNRKTDLTDHTDLFAYGVDSVAGMQIRSRIRRLLPSKEEKLPMTLVEDCGTVDGLTNYVLKRRHGEDVEADNADERDYMRQLVTEYSIFATEAPNRQYVNGKTDEDAKKDVVVLTGATGALGAHILSQYRAMSSIGKIYCLVRGSDEHAARERVTKALEQRKLAALDSSLDSKIVVLPAQLGEDKLGLDEQTYTRISQEATIIMHVAWSVNFRMKLRSFVKDNIAGVRNLLNLAITSSGRQAPRFAFCSSVASVTACQEDTVPELLIDDPLAATPLGYSKSKWVAEQICAQAANAFSTALKGRIGIFRVGQLAGDTEHGVWNSSEAWPMMLSSVKETGSLPDLQGEVLDWLPVDIAATALIQGTETLGGREQGEEAKIGGSSSPPSVFHVVNEHTTPEWRDLLGWLHAREDFRTVSPAAWVKELEHLADGGSAHPALKLLDMWKKTYGGQDGEDRTEGQSTKRKLFALERTKERVEVLRAVEPVDEEYFGKLWTWIRDGM